MTITAVMPPAIQWPFRLVHWPQLTAIITAMTGKQREKSASLRRAWYADFDSKFRAYLDGYFLSFDFYPTCERHLFIRNDAYALWSDFMRVASEVSESSAKLISSPERFAELTYESNHDFQRARREATDRAIEKAVHSAGKEN
jgi:hypothetical protein